MWRRLRKGIVGKQLEHIFVVREQTHNRVRHGIRATIPKRRTTSSNRSGADKERRFGAAGSIPVAYNENDKVSSSRRRRSLGIRSHTGRVSSRQTTRSDLQSEMAPPPRWEASATDNCPTSLPQSHKRSTKASQH